MLFWWRSLDPESCISIQFPEAQVSVPEKGSGDASLCLSRGEALWAHGFHVAWVAFSLLKSPRSFSLSLVF